MPDADAALDSRISVLRCNLRCRHELFTHAISFTYILLFFVWDLYKMIYPRVLSFQAGTEIVARYGHTP